MVVTVNELDIPITYLLCFLGLYECCIGCLAVAALQSCSSGTIQGICA